MVESVQSSRMRVASLCCGLLLLAGLTFGFGQSRAAAAAPNATGEGAGISMINGKASKTSAWPWQVALATSSPSTRSESARKRHFCGGSLIAPDLVITAAHCVADLTRGQLRRIEVIAGRTWLSNKTGSSAFVKSRLMPRKPNGQFRYSSWSSSSAWDVALLKLKRRLPAGTIKLAGKSEASSLSPGTVVKVTGWGVRSPFSNMSSNVLRVANQVVLNDAVCRRDNGRGYQPGTMICLGGPAGNTSTCFGDSGGPMFARMSTGWRIVGVTSFGDPLCLPIAPSVDARVSGNAIRSWVRKTAMRVSGVNPVGVNGVSPPKRDWCRVPKLGDRTVAQSRTALKKADCRLGKARPVYYGYGRRGRIGGASLPQGWLAPAGTKIDVWVNR